MSGTVPASMTDVVRDFLRDDGWPIVEGDQDGYPVLETVFGGTHSAWRCHAQVFEPYGQLVFESVLPFTVAPEHRPAVAALVLAANWKLLTGAFQLDSWTGALRFRTSLLTPDGEVLTRRLVKGVVYSNVLTVDRCYEPLAAVAKGEERADDALVRLAL